MVKVSRSWPSSSAGCRRPTSAACRNSAWPDRSYCVQVAIIVLLAWFTRTLPAASVIEQLS
ncbi:hypothetical protein DIQ79_19640 [Mycolicibacterium smegmatis]|uniref:Uncharacterized protein n=1 Tax=Mycolicibacterium smegmatis (strain ATCC 700084 / mc(2)155) TaxID=246196 RepID=A0QTR0_MYCS2|nr:hypothetical protein MSMEG_1933 [Mycolicibacterium smegmatis MC2 155]TBM48072.1 hypothetical protein DIQ86_09905 [Mycolicibacterium smegmatis]TBH34203.1 hypothetical protein EYS45_18995 [Mycolicibacterium smegmatis MC2 155]TBM49502.1 hypothetical protein DIQ85_19645 [Mycolicibacterium smegmatis]TBM59703.1 hypothetical protein DIQ83_19705 [Mycolicibacterium smegmatis]